MARWSAENATNAYLKTLRMGQNAKEPDVAEFISALAAGNNAQLIVTASATTDYSLTMGLVAAAHQTGGRVVSVLPGHKEIQSSKQVLGSNVCQVEFAIGEAQSLLLNHYTDADFVLIDCNLGNHEGIFGSVRSGNKRNGAIIVGYNAFANGSWWSCGIRTQLLPIGEGLLLTRVPAEARFGCASGCNKKSKWIVKVDQCTGEEHVFRVRFPQQKQNQA